MNDPVHLLWLGSIADEAAMLSSPAISPAANRWQTGLFSGLGEAGCRIRILGHHPEPVWPRGRLRFRANEGDAPLPGPLPVPQNQVGYWNLPRLRESFLEKAYVRGFERILVNGFRPDAVLCYNLYPHSLAVGREAKRMGIPWVPVIADAPGEPAEFARLERQLGEANGCVFLSWHLFSNWSATPKLHLDGGVTVAPAREQDPPRDGEPKIVFYSGALNRFGGVDLLLDAFSQIPDKNIRLWICGKGFNEKISQMTRADDRIVFYGCVPEDKLRELSRQAWVMVNPRPSQVAGNENNFPSKLFEYLSYGKPVVSTWTLGLHPVYRSLLAVVPENTPDAMASAILGVLGWDRERRMEHVAKCTRFILEEKLWSLQAGRLMNWLTDCIRGGKTACEKVESS